jgi:hypothetical protein
MKVCFPHLHSFAKRDSITLTDVLQLEYFHKHFNLPLSEMVFVNMILQALPEEGELDQWSYIRVTTPIQWVKCIIISLVRNMCTQHLDRFENLVVNLSTRFSSGCYGRIGLILDVYCRGRIWFLIHTHVKYVCYNEWKPWGICSFIALLQKIAGHLLEF